ncbi:MAG: copper resistance protein NlpE [Methylococcaceae bacterium]
MQTVKIKLKQTIHLIFLGVLLSSNSVMAVTDQEAREGFAKARAMNHQEESDRAAHLNHVDKNQEFHGVFYGFLPCNHCNGMKVTLSLKQNNHYLMVTQPAKESSREFFEKGKYSWDDDIHAVILTPRDKEAEVREYLIKDEGTLIQLDGNGKQIIGDSAESYVLRRSDTVKSREVHIH